MGEELNAKSGTGMVHAVSHTNGDKSVKVLCGPRRWIGDYSGSGLCPGPKVWTRTEEAITCKRCLKMLYPDKEQTVKFSEGEVKRLIKVLRIVDPCFLPRLGQITDCLTMLEKKIT